jgi:hypothetical protein
MKKCNFCNQLKENELVYLRLEFLRQLGAVVDYPQSKMGYEGLSSKNSGKIGYCPTISRILVTRMLGS